MTVSEEQWLLAKTTIGEGGLSVIAAVSDCDRIRGEFAAKGIDAEVVALDTKTYRGKAAALKAAFESTKGEYVFVLGAGASASAALLPRYLEEMTVKCADIVIGSKRHPESEVAYPWHRRLLSRVYFGFVRLFLGVKVTDTESGVALYRRETLRYALERMLAKSAAFELEILAIASEKGARIFEAPVGVSEEVRVKSDEFGWISRKFAWSKINDTLAVFYRLRILHYYAKCMVPKKLDHDPLVSVVIACPAGSWMLDECLAALAKQTYRNFEVLVLPDEEIDTSSTLHSSLFTHHFLPTGKVRPAEKRNLGIKEAKGEIVAFIDDDAYPDPHWLEYAVKYFGEKDIGAVGGPGVTPPGDKRLAYLGGRVYDNWLVSGNYRYRYHAGGVRMDVEDYPSCNLFVRKDVLDRIGGYRTDFWPGEDTLLCKDIIDNWKRIVYDPWVVVYHHRRPLFLPHLRQLGSYAFHRGYFCKRFPSNSLRLSYFVPTLFDLYVAFLAVVGILNLTKVDCLRITFHHWGYWPFWLYLVLVALTTFSLRPHHWLLTALGVFSSHVWYGIRFIQGLCARKAPCEYIGKDHARRIV